MSSLGYKRLLFSLDRENLSKLKLVLLQFKKETKEPLYIEMLIEQNQSAEEIERLLPFLFRDRLLSCISNFAYSKS